ISTVPFSIRVTATQPLSSDKKPHRAARKFKCEGIVRLNKQKRRVINAV
ncbi:hypothetical protein PF004_g27909, partial [Phytophthora fragariae]